MKRILVTGGCGFLGSHVCELFMRKGWEVIPYDNLTKFEYSRTPYKVEAVRDYNLKYLEKLGIKTTIADVRDLAELKKVVAKCDLIAHCAAQPAMTIAYEEPILDFDVNARGFLNVLEVARAGNIPVANCSTVHVYGNGINDELRECASRFENMSGAIDEGHRILSGSLSPLHASKRTTEIYGQVYTDSFGLPVASFRLTGIYGPRQFGGEDHGWVANFAIKAVMGRPVKIYGTDKQVRDILYVRDAAQAFMDWYNAGCPPGIYNIGGGEKSAISLQECLGLLMAITGRKIPIAIEKERKGDLYWYISDYGKAIENFGWKPETLPHSGISRLVDWIKENKEMFE